MSLHYKDRPARDQFGDSMSLNDSYHPHRDDSSITSEHMENPFDALDDSNRVHNSQSNLIRGATVGSSRKSVVDPASTSSNRYIDEGYTYSSGKQKSLDEAHDLSSTYDPTDVTRSGKYEDLGMIKLN